jgi:hypothetical protein
MSGRITSLENQYGNNVQKYLAQFIYNFQFLMCTKLIVPYRTVKTTLSTVL